MILLFLMAGLSLIYFLSEKPTRDQMEAWLVPSSHGVWREWKLWTLITGPLLVTKFSSLIFQGLLLWLFVPNLEKWWGTPRFLAFVAYTSVAGTIAATLFGLVIGAPGVIDGLDPFLYASIVAFGIIYARQPVRFFGVLPLTGRQLMYGILAFLTLFVVLNGAWTDGAAFVAAILVAVMLTSERWSPRLAWLRYRQRRARSHLDVLQGGLGLGRPPGKGEGKGGKTDKRWIN
jgi:membrane associated rhomboid family serine protease